MRLHAKTDQEIFETFNILLETKYVEYAYADLFAEVLGITQKRLNEITMSLCHQTACQLMAKGHRYFIQPFLSDTQDFCEQVSISIFNILRFEKYVECLKDFLVSFSV